MEGAKYPEEHSRQKSFHKDKVRYIQLIESKENNGFDRWRENEAMSEDMVNFHFP